MLSHMVLSVVEGSGGIKTFQQTLNSTFYLKMGLFGYGCCPLDKVKWNLAFINCGNNRSLDILWLEKLFVWKSIENDKKCLESIRPKELK